MPPDLWLYQYQGKEYQMLKKSQSFRYRAFISFSVTLSFLVAAISGLVLYIRPEGSLARWMGWQILGFNKKQWEAIHTSMVLVFIIIAVIHLLYNWKSLAGYLKRNVNAVRRAGFELACAVVLVTSCFLLTLVHLPPASWVNDLRGKLKDDPSLLLVQPPAPGADQMTLTGISTLNAMSPGELIARMKNLGLLVDKEKNWAEIARDNQLSPQELYMKVFNKKK